MDSRKRPFSLLLLCGFLVTQLAAGSSCSAEPESDETVAARIDQIMAESYQAGKPGAAILVARKGDVILKKGYGLANLEHGVPVTPGTVFRLASVTKIFTATGILLLANQEKLDLEDDIRRHLPGYPTGDRKITVANLLAHTAGLPDYLDRPDNMQWVRSEFTTDELIDSLKDREPAFDPGAKNAYSNSNYILLGKIIEQISGLSYGEFLRKHIFQPAGMERSYYGGTREIVPGRAAPYEPLRLTDDEQDWSRFLNARFYSLSSVHAAGGALSTVEDLFKLHDALSRGELVGKETWQRGYRPVTLNDGKTANAAVGWQLDRAGGRRAAMKGGALPGVCTWFVTLPDDGITVILLSNRSAGEPRCGRLALRLAGIAAGD
jgi:CubicO group peptidase (beta-lactamase class C family)